jgi:hypothetical protein
MVEIKEKIFKITQRWRRTAINTRDVAKEMPNLLARGHMHGLSDGLIVAADEIDEALDENKVDLPIP